MASNLTPDLCVIGAGPAGLAAAQTARALGAEVILVEADRLGGGMLHLGSVPSKALAAAAARAQAMRTGPQFGIGAEEPKVNFGRVQDHVQQVIAALAPQTSAEHLGAAGIDLIKAAATFVDHRTLMAGDQAIRARRYIIATGSRPMPIEIAGLSDVTAFTAETIFDNTRRPGHLLIVGGDSLALEIAQAHRRLGADVTVLLPETPLADSDPELREVVMTRLREEGIAFREKARPTAVTPRGPGVTLTVHEAEAEAAETINASHLLLLGRRVPAIDGLDPDKAGIRRDAADPTRLILSRNHRTSNRRIYVVGEAAGVRSVHAAVAQAKRTALRALLGRAAAGVEALPIVCYTDPELAEVGLSEPAAAMRLKDRYEVRRAAFAENDRARATGETYGLAKIIAEPGGRILGAGVVGPSAGEIINLFALAMAQGLKVSDLGSFVAPHPSLSEIVNRLAEGSAANTAPSPWTQRLLQLRRWLP